MLNLLTTGEKIIHFIDQQCRSLWIVCENPNVTDYIDWIARQAFDAIIRKCSSRRFYHDISIGTKFCNFILPVNLSCFPPHWYTQHNNYKNKRQRCPYTLIICQNIQ